MTYNGEIGDLVSIDIIRINWSFKSSFHPNMSSLQGNRRSFGENLSAPITSQILSSLRSGAPSGISSISQSQVPNIFSNNIRAARLNDFANMLALPSVIGPSGRLVQPRISQSHSGASVHPSFRSKAVCALGCKYCGTFFILNYQGRIFV